MEAKGLLGAASIHADEEDAGEDKLIVYKSGDCRSKVPEPVRVRGAREHGGRGGAWLSTGAQIGRPLQWEGNPWWL